MHRQATRSGGQKELSSVIPVNRVNLTARLQNLALLCATEIPDGYSGRVLGNRGQENTILGEEKGFHRARHGESGSGRASLDIEDLDLPVHATSSNQVAVRVDLDREKS